MSSSVFENRNIKVLSTHLGSLRGGRTRHLRVDRSVRLEIVSDLPLLSFVGEDGSDVEDETVRGNWGGLTQKSAPARIEKCRKIVLTLVVELETSLSGGDGGKDRKPVDTRLDVGSGSVLVRQHGS